MVLNTHPNDRKEMVRAISELTGLEASYLYMPTCAYHIGPVTVNLNGTIACDDEAMVKVIQPMLVEHGWLNTEQEPAEVPADSKEPNSVKKMKITMPIEGWTISQMTNLMRMLYSKQNLINRMLDDSLLFIDMRFFTMVFWNPPVTSGDFEARVQSAIEAGYIEGLKIADEEVALSIPIVENGSIQWKAYSDLLRGILRTAEVATRIYLKLNDDPENEKYRGNSFLMRLGFGGPEHKPLRHVLLGHLNGYAAFRSAAGMQAHREKYAQLRRKQREEARP